jgi:hypothetical protein
LADVIACAAAGYGVRVSVAHFLLGVAALPIGLTMLLGRDAIVAREPRKPLGGVIQSPMAFLVLGVLLTLVGITQVVTAFV